jgi:hypothetical protein
MFDQYATLTIIGVIILLIGIALYAARKKGGLMLTLIGGLWLFTMGLYYGLVATKLYGSRSILLNVIGIIILIVGATLSIVYIKKYLGQAKR